MKPTRVPSVFSAAARHHVRLLATVIGCALVLAFVLNTVVDPMRMNRWPWALQSLDRYKKISDEIRTGKAGIVRSRSDWQIAVVGSSRVAHAFDPLHPGWDGPAVNLGLPGGFLYETIAMANYAAQHASLRVLIIGIDPGDLSSSYDSRPRSDFYASPLAPMSDQDRINLTLRHHFSVSSFEASVKTIFDAIADRPMRYSAEGFRIRRPQDERGDQLAFIKRGLSTRPTGELPAPYSVSEINADKFALLANAVSEFQRQGIHVKLLYLPRHALNYVPPPGVVPAELPFEHERRALADLAETANRAAPDLPPVEAWDFNGFRDIDGEALPSSSDRRMTYWNDLDHYTADVGGLILSRVMSWPSPEGLDPSYGDRLSSDTIEAHLAEARARHSRYLRETGPADIALKRSLAPTH